METLTNIFLIFQYQLSRQLKSMYKESETRLRTSSLNAPALTKAASNHSLQLEQLKDDNLYYKEANKDLKTRVRAMKSQVSTISEDNAALRKELKNMKVMKRKHCFLTTTGWSDSHNCNCQSR